MEEQSREVHAISTSRGKKFSNFREKKDLAELNGRELLSLLGMSSPPCAILFGFQGTVIEIS